MFTIIQLFQVYGEIVGGIFLVGALMQQLFYIMVATSNPGIVTESEVDNETEEESKTRKYLNFIEKILSDL